MAGFRLSQGFPAAALLSALLLAGVWAQQKPAPSPALDYVCPMHPEVRSAVRGKCPKCGMTLVPGIPDPVEYPLELKLTPSAPRPGQPVQLTFAVKDPHTGGRVTRFEMVHERLFHMFLVSQDLEFFEHDHPDKLPDGTFRYEARLPKPGMYRILADYYPSDGTPQLSTRTIFAGAGELRPARLAADLVPKETANMQVTLTTQPEAPLAGYRTLLAFRVRPADGLEPYLGAWGHMLAASDDLIDLIHTHPSWADGGAEVDFTVIFPRGRPFRLWVQFQRKGTVNTAVFTIPVRTLE
ncbi:MAG TPA: heavy metal-binding domain-containing protein [Bryobacteraceae bacterium]|nr:heavy metal-binding domain-containing protein [Bryobacteraceae bacterium]